MDLQITALLGFHLTAFICLLFFPWNLELVKDLKISKLEGTLVQLPQFTSKKQTVAVRSCSFARASQPGYQFDFCYIAE